MHKVWLILWICLSWLSLVESLVLRGIHPPNRRGIVAVPSQKGSQNLDQKSHNQHNVNVLIAIDICPLTFYMAFIGKGTTPFPFCEGFFPIPVLVRVSSMNILPTGLL